MKNLKWIPTCKRGEIWDLYDGLNPKSLGFVCWVKDNNSYTCLKFDFRGPKYSIMTRGHLSMKTAARELLKLVEKYKEVNNDRI